MFSESDHMFCSEIPSDNHAKTKRKGIWEMIKPRNKYPRKCPDKPKNTDKWGNSFGFYGGKFENQSIEKIVPYPWSCRKEISENRTYEITNIARMFSQFWYFSGRYFDIFRKWWKHKYDHADSRDKIHGSIRNPANKKRSEKSSTHHSDTSSDNKSLWNFSIFMKKIYSSDSISYFSELESNSCHLWRNAKKYHKTYWHGSCSSRWKTPEVCRKYSDEEDENEGDFLGHSVICE